MSIEKRLARLENATGETPTGAAVAIFKAHVCGEPTPQAGEQETGPTCKVCGAALTILRGNTNAHTVYLIPDNGRDPQA